MSNKIYIGTEEIGGSGGSADLTNYYNKSHIDSSYGVIDASLKYLDASVKELAARPGGGGSNISKLSDLTNDCDFRPITYITKDDYDDLVEAETLDDDTMYVITDLADSDDLAGFVTLDDISGFATNLDVANLVLKSELANYATNSDAAGYITRAEAGQIVETHYSTYITSYNTLSANYQTVSTQIGDIESVLDEILEEQEES